MFLWAFYEIIGVEDPNHVLLGAWGRRKKKKQNKTTQGAIIRAMSQEVEEIDGGIVKLSMESASILSQFTFRSYSPIVTEARRQLQCEHIKLGANSTKCRNSARRLCLAAARDQGTQGVGDKDGVIIVDHGSRRKESNLMLKEFVAMFRDKTGYPIVEPAHMELAEPSIRDAFTSCVQQGASRVIVSPFFLFPGRHWHKDIPSLTAEAAKEHPSVQYMITAPLGLHELLVDVMNDRIKHCLSHVAGDAAECSVCAGTGKCQLYLMNNELQMSNAASKCGSNSEIPLRPSDSVISSFSAEH